MSLFMINPPVVSSFVAAGHLNLKYSTGGFILYLEDFNSTTLSGGLFALKRQKEPGVDQRQAEESFALPKTNRFVSRKSC